jgi:hypothetical protein
LSSSHISLMLKTFPPSTLHLYISLKGRELREAHRQRQAESSSVNRGTRR